MNSYGASGATPSVETIASALDRSNRAFVIMYEKIGDEDYSRLLIKSDKPSIVLRTQATKTSWALPAMYRFAASAVDYGKH